MKYARYSEEEIQIIKDCYVEKGGKYVAKILGRSYESVLSKALSLNLHRYRCPPSFDAEKHRKKAKQFVNENPDGLDAVMERQRKQDEKKVMVRIDSHTVLLVAKSKLKETLKKYKVKKSN